MLPIPVASGREGECVSMSLGGVWWFSDEDDKSGSSNIPDIFKRNGIIVSNTLFYYN